MTAFDAGWAVLKMPWTPEQGVQENYPPQTQRPLPKPIDRGPFRHETGWLRDDDDDGRSWVMSNDQEWIWNPFMEKYIQVDRMMAPLLGSLWARGISTKFSDTGGDLGPNHLEPYVEELAASTVAGARGAANGGPFNRGRGYLWFGDAGVPPEFRNLSGVEVSTKDGKEETIRWGPAHDMEHLRTVYEAAGVPFPDEHMKEGLYQWR